MAFEHLLVIDGDGVLAAADSTLAGRHGCLLLDSLIAVIIKDDWIWTLMLVALMMVLALKMNDERQSLPYQKTPRQPPHASGRKSKL